MKSILQIYKLSLGPSSTLNHVPYAACREIALDIHNSGKKIHHVEIQLYNEYARLAKEAGIKNDVESAFALSSFGYEIKTDVPVPAACKTSPYVFDVIVYKSEKDAIGKRRVFATGAGNYHFAEIREHDAIPFNTFADVLKWFKDNPGKTYLDFATLGDKKEDIIAMYHQGQALAHIQIMTGLMSTDEIVTGVDSIHYVRRAQTVWKHDSTELSQSEDLTRVISAFAYALGERNAEKQVFVSAPTLCSSSVFWAVVEYLAKEKQIPHDKLIQGFAAAGIFASLMDKANALAEQDVGCQGPMGTACGMAAVVAAVCLYDADIVECGKAFEMALEHCLGIICDCSTGMPIVPCVQRGATYATRAYEIAILNHSLMETPDDLCKLDDVITTVKETGHDLLVKYKRLGLGGFNEHAPYLLKKPAEKATLIQTKKPVKGKKK